MKRGRTRLSLARWYVMALLVATMMLCSCSGDDEKRPELIDDNSLVDEWSFQFQVEQGLEIGEAGLVEPAAGWDFRVVWIALPCQQAPTVRTEGEQQLLAVVVDPGPELHPGGAECDSMGVWHAVDLRTSSAPPADIEVSVVE